MEKMELFHVHTVRCKHASNDNDEEYIVKAIGMGADKITFTDHAPFPENPFGNRMDIEELSEYVETLNRLREKYKHKIQVDIGLEIEYLPSYENYYQALQESEQFDLLMLGQHFYELEPGEYSFSFSPDEQRKYEAKGCCEAMLKGIRTGYFDVVAHPDRIFRRCGEWNSKLETLSQQLIQFAMEYGMILEKNLSSMESAQNYRPEFWSLVPKECKIKIGTDAHSILELERIYAYSKEGSHVKI